MSLHRQRDIRGKSLIPPLAYSEASPTNMSLTKGEALSSFVYKLWTGPGGHSAESCLEAFSPCSAVILVGYNMPSTIS